MPGIDDDAYIGQWVHPATLSPLDMVGRKGVHDMDWVADFIGSCLGVGPTDDVLDLCCGNGLVTVRIARHAKSVVAVDFSRALLKQAIADFNAENITYLEGNARKISELLAGRAFHKAYISAAFQYFDAEAGEEVLRGLHRLLISHGKLAIFDIPDQSRKWSHQMRAAMRLLVPTRRSPGDQSTNQRFHGLRQRIDYFARNVGHMIGLGARNDLGWWWKRDEFVRLAERCGFAATIYDQPRQNPHHTYRFDAVLMRVEAV